MANKQLSISAPLFDLLPFERNKLSNLEVLEKTNFTRKELALSTEDKSDSNKPAIFTEDRKAIQIFKNEIYYALLHNKKSVDLIVEAIKQAEEKEISYVLCKISDEAKKMRDWARQVKIERMKAISFIRLKPINERGILVGQFEVRHNTEELILLHFMKRFPTFKIALFF